MGSACQLVWPILKLDPSAENLPERPWEKDTCFLESLIPYRHSSSNIALYGPRLEYHNWKIQNHYFAKNRFIFRVGGQVLVP